MKQPSTGPAGDPTAQVAADAERQARLAAESWAQLKRLAA
jgi:hypothetical protein